MKRVKFMLAAITMIAAVGGTLAFKASKINLQKAYTCDAAFTCVALPLNNVTTTVRAQAQITITDPYTITTTNVQGLPCDNAIAPCTILPSTFIRKEF